MPIGYTANPGFFERAFRKFSTSVTRMSQREVVVTDEAKEGFRKSQRLAYDCVQAVHKELKEGMTEKQAAKLLQTYLSDHGAKNFLHRPFAWFGNHSRFDEYKFYVQYHPSKKVLKPDEPGILDVSPILNGYIGDIGYSFCLNPSPKREKAMVFLRGLRQKIPAMFASDKTAAQIWKEIDTMIVEAGFENIHAKYPYNVLGHRVYKVYLPNIKLPLLPFSSPSWFSIQGQLAFSSHGVLGELLTPEHEGGKTGFWAIEPHIGGEGFGAKFEEILVIEKDRCYWLDEEVPHMKNH